MKKRVLSLILALVLVLAAAPVKSQAADGSAKGQPLTVEDEMYGVSITFDGYLRTETHTYRVTNFDTEWELERTFYVVEDNSPIHIQALPGREYGTGQGDYDYTDEEVWDKYAWNHGHGLTWSVEEKAFLAGSSSDPNVLSGPITETAFPHEGDFMLSDNGEGKQYNCYLCESDFARLVSIDQPTPAAPTALAADQAVKVDGKDVTFYAYALVDEKGGITNYVKLRDVAAVLSGTKGQFEVGWNGSINLETGKPYTAVGGELEKTFVGNQPYVPGDSPVNVNGRSADLEAIVLVDAKGGNYNYFKLRDLGRALGFNVGWSVEKGIFIESDQPYTDAD